MIAQCSFLWDFLRTQRLQARESMYRAEGFLPSCLIDVRWDALLIEDNQFTPRGLMKCIVTQRVLASRNTCLASGMTNNGTLIPPISPLLMTAGSSSVHVRGQEKLKATHFMKRLIDSDFLLDAQSLPFRAHLPNAARARPSLCTCWLSNQPWSRTYLAGACAAR